MEVGLPAKSGVSGALMVIVPNVFGFATFSPRLNSFGNSVRGVEFCKRLVNSYRVHSFEPLRSGNTGAKIDPRRNGMKEEQQEISRMAWAVQVGDVNACRVRDAFLFSLCQTAAVSPDGLSEDALAAIQDCHEEIYQSRVNDKLMADIASKVKQTPQEVKFLEDLTQGLQITDSMRSLIVMAILDIVMLDGEADDEERGILVRIGPLLGIDKDVILMELNRYEKHVGHRFQEYTHCNMLEKSMMGSMVGIDLSGRSAVSGGSGGGRRAGRRGGSRRGGSRTTPRNSPGAGSLPPLNPSNKISSPAGNLPPMIPMAKVSSPAGNLPSMNPKAKVSSPERSKLTREVSRSKSGRNSFAGMRAQLLSNTSGSFAVEHPHSAVRKME